MMTTLKMLRMIRLKATRLRTMKARMISDIWLTTSSDLRLFLRLTLNVALLTSIFWSSIFNFSYMQFCHEILILRCMTRIHSFSTTLTFFWENWTFVWNCVIDIWTSFMSTFLFFINMLKKRFEEFRRKLNKCLMFDDESEAVLRRLSATMSRVLAEDTSRSRVMTIIE